MERSLQRFPSLWQPNTTHDTASRDKPHWYLHGTLRLVNAIRPALRQAAAYPFTPIDAPIKLDQNESGYDFPPELKHIALEKMQHADWNRYPDIHANRLRQKVAAHLGWLEAGLVLTSGSNVLIHALAQAAGIGQRVLTVSPAFSLYGLSGQLLGAEVTEPRLNPDFSLPMPELLATLEQPTPGVAFLATPHAPTGTLPSLAEVQTLVTRADKNWLLVLDEAYFEYSGRSHMNMLEQENVCILRTFSKAWGLGGVRFGMLLAQPKLAEQIQKILSPFNLSVLIEAVIQTALEHPEYAKTRVQEVLSERARVFAALEHLQGWKIYPSAANYHLIRTPDAKAAHTALLERGVLVRKQDSYAGLEGCIRVSVGTPQENDAFIALALELGNTA